MSRVTIDFTYLSRLGSKFHAKAEALDYDQECRLLKFDVTLERQKTEKLLKQCEQESEDGDSA